MSRRERAALRREARLLRRMAKPSRNLGSLSAEEQAFVFARRRRGLLFGSLALSILALGSLVLATFFTPILAIEKIEVSGVKRLKEVQITDALRPELGKPLTVITQEDVARRLQRFSIIGSLSLERRPPHTLIVRIVERIPVCIVRLGKVLYLYDAAGVRLGVTDTTERHPIIVTSGEPSTSPDFAEAMRVLLDLPAELLPKIESVTAQNLDSVVLTLRGYANKQVIWGDSSEAVLKAKVLQVLLDTRKNRDAVLFDVSAPNTPVVRFAGF